MAKKSSKAAKSAPKKVVNKPVKAAVSAKSKKPAAKPSKVVEKPVKAKVAAKKAKTISKSLKKTTAASKKSAVPSKKSPSVKKPAPKKAPKKSPPSKASKPVPKAVKPVKANSKSAKAAPAPKASSKKADKKSEPAVKKLVLPPLKTLPPRKSVFPDEAPEIVIPKKSPFSVTFLKKQKQRLFDLRNSLMDAMEGVAKDSLRTRPEGSEASVGGMHMADAGSDAYDRDFALSLLSKEQDALYEINEALKRIDIGSYGICEMTGKPVNEERLEALPFARYTREAMEQIERDQMGGRGRRQPVRSVFGLEDDKDEDDEEEEASTANTKKSDNESSLDFIKE